MPEGESQPRATQRVGDDGRAVRAPHFVQSLERGLAVICVFGEEDPHLTLTEVAQRTGLTRAAARRFLLTLADLGYVRSDGRQFSLTPRVLELGYGFLSSQSVSSLAQPHLERLVEEVRESSSLSVLDGPDVVYIARVATSRIMRVAINIGTRFPAFATSMGRAMLAYMPDPDLDNYIEKCEFEPLTDRTLTTKQDLRAALEVVRQTGYAIVDQELEEGLRSVAAPILASDGTPVAAVNISTHVSRTSLRALRRDIVPPLLATAGRIASELAMTAEPTGRHRA